MILPSKEYIELFKKTTGAFSVTEMIALMNICSQVPDGLFAELGTHKGKSAVASIFGLPKSKHGVYHLIEPEFIDDKWEEDVTNTIIEAMALCKSEIGVRLFPAYSTEYIPNQTSFSYVFVDSGVHDDLVMQEVKMLEDKMISNGIIAFHDYKNQFTAVERAYDYLVSTGKYEPISIDWEAIKKYVRENDLETGNNSWHIYEEHPFPNFVGAVRRK